MHLRYKLDGVSQPRYLGARRHHGRAEDPRSVGLAAATHGPDDVCIPQTGGLLPLVHQGFQRHRRKTHQVVAERRLLVVA
jgi:hypothetical protein